MQKINVLILSAGRRVELVNCFKQARDKLGVGGTVVAADIVTTAPALYFADCFFLLPRIKDPDYIDKLIEECKRYEIDLVIPTIDTELEILSENREKIQAGSGARVMISEPEVVRACCNKIITAKLLSECGFAVPKVITDEMIARGEYHLPLFIKPLDGSSSINAFKVRTKEELDFFCKYVEKPIIQEFISGTEYTVDCFCDFEGNAITIVPRIRLATRSGEILKGKIDKNASIIAAIRSLSEKVKFFGHITVQGFLEADGTFCIVEINPRFGGGAPMSINAGADSCENLYRLMNGEKLRYNENYENGIVFSRFDNSIRVIS